MNVPVFMEGVARELTMLLAFLTLCVTRGQEIPSAQGLCSVSFHEIKVLMLLFAQLSFNFFLKFLWVGDDKKTTTTKYQMNTLCKYFSETRYFLILTFYRNWIFNVALFKIKNYWCFECCIILSLELQKIEWIIFALKTVLFFIFPMKIFFSLLAYWYLMFLKRNRFLAWNVQ